MKTREEIKTQLLLDNPTSDGLTAGNPVYDARIETWADAAFAAQNSPILGWPTVQQFMDAFTDAELVAVWDSTDANVKGLRTRLLAWYSTVLADDARIQLGLGLLVQLGILTDDRKTEILNTATPV